MRFQESQYRDRAVESPAEQAFPRMVYQADGRYCLVHSQEEYDSALAIGWGNEPSGALDSRNYVHTRPTGISLENLPGKVQRVKAPVEVKPEPQPPAQLEDPGFLDKVVRWAKQHMSPTPENTTIE